MRTISLQPFSPVPRRGGRGASGRLWYRRGVNDDEVDPHTHPQVRGDFRSGDVHAFERLARRDRDLLFTLCVHLTRDKVEAEDYAQEALARALSAHHRYDPARSFRTWVLTIAANLCRDRARTAWLRRVVRLDGSTLEEAFGRTPRPEADDADRRVRLALEGLPWRYREALTLHHLDELSYLEMAEITGVSVDALKQRVHRGSAMLRDRIERLYPALGRAPVPAPAPGG